MTTLMKCDYCQLIYEGLYSDDCPKCLSHFHSLLAQYLSFNDEETYDENKEDPKYLR